MKVQPVVVNGILAHDNRVLIAKRSMRKEVAPGKYHLPGGHVKDGELLNDAIAREFLEELALEVQPTDVSYDFSYRDGSHTIRGVCFVLDWDGDAQSIQIDHAENDEVCWIAKNELGKYFDPSDHNYSLIDRFFAEMSSV